MHGLYCIAHLLLLSCISIDEQLPGYDIFQWNSILIDNVINPVYIAWGLFEIEPLNVKNNFELDCDYALNNAQYFVYK